MALLGVLAVVEQPTSITPTRRPYWPLSRSNLSSKNNHVLLDFHRLKRVHVVVAKGDTNQTGDRKSASFKRARK
ncbi:hypothetical protein CCP4SC76_6340002 [Gammaproteobacteria bacterium]